MHFVDRFPLFVDPTDPAAPAIITFTYIDPGESTLAAFKNHLRKYLPLFRSLENLAFLYISPSPAHFAAAERWFSSLVSVALNRYLRQGAALFSAASRLGVEAIRLALRG